MRILIIGAGSREHALIWKIQQSTLCSQIYTWPARSNLAPFTELHSLEDIQPSSSGADLARQCLKQKIELVICGPEAPLSQGFAESFREFNISFFGPITTAAKLETSKSFARSMMTESNIPSPRYYLSNTLEQAKQMGGILLKQAGACVVKADGLRGGKGVFVCTTSQELENALSKTFPVPPGESNVLIEECLYGREVSMFYMLVNSKPTFLGSAVDFKRLEDNDLGPNTGGMGSYTPVNWLPENSESLVEETILSPLLKCLQEKDIPYHGFLYIGLMWTKSGPKVIEFNVRMGDPETQALALSDTRDWLELICQPTTQNTQPSPKKPTVCVNIVDPSYPSFKPIKTPSQIVAAQNLIEIESQHDVKIFCGNLQFKQSSGEYHTLRGRCFTIVGAADSFEQARHKVYAACATIKQIWPECRWRADIAAKAESHSIGEPTCER